MVFCYQNCSDLLYENCSCDQEKLLKFKAESREFCKIFEITRTIHSNSERSEPGMGVSEKVSAVGFCLGSGLFGSCNSIIEGSLLLL